MKELDLSTYFLNPINVFSTIFFLIVVIIWAQFKSNNLKDGFDKRLYLLNVYHKLFFALIFSLFYLSPSLGRGGDTYSYWVSAGALKNLMYYNFDNFWDVITNDPTLERLYGLFNYNTGYPFRYIYMEEESFFVAKVMFVFRIFTFDNYFAATFLIAFISANASWSLYKVAKGMEIFDKWLMPVFVLLLPSVAFWASGISKDTIVLVSILILIHQLSFLLLRIEPVRYVKRIIIIAVCMFFIYKTRPFILYAMTIPLFWMYFTSIVNKIKNFGVLKVLIKTIVYSIFIGLFSFILTFISDDQLLQSSDSFSHAMIVQQDFTQNSVYGEEEGKRYSLGEVEFSPVGILKAVPESILAGIYRPYIWESLSPSLFFNGLESVLIIFLTFRFFLVKFFMKVKIIRTNELLIFALGFVLFIAFMAGFTSILFGVLVRIRAPLLPFLGLLLTIDLKAYLMKTQELKTE